MATPNVKRYYNYIYAEPLTGSIFYIGKGCGNRSENHLLLAKNKRVYQNSNRWLQYKIKKILKEGLEPIILRVAFFETEKEAYNNEIKLIKDALKKGYRLCNIRPGGEGFTTEGAKEYSNQPEVKARVSKESKKRWNNPDFKKIVSKKISMATKNNPRVKQARKKRWENPEYREKMCAMMRSKWKDPEYLKKMEERNKNTFTEEYSKKMAEITRKSWAERRGV